MNGEHFTMIDALNSYNAILNLHKTMSLTCNQNMKFPTPHGIDEVRDD